ncbi:MAG: AAA family ATPase [Chloroflexota bacterium]|nr:AAA family ATPase [Chloroflexota bacterium]
MQDRHGKTIAFVGPRGGTGTTTVATNVALAIASYSHARSALLDLNVGRTITDHLLDLPADGGATVVDLVPVLAELGGEPVSDEILGQAQVTHASGLRVIVASRGIDGGVGADAVRQLVQGLARANDVVILDLPSTFDEPTFAAMEAADRVLIVATPDVPSLKRAKALLQRVREIKPEPGAVKVVLNQASRSGDLTLQQIEDFLGEPVWTLIPSAAAEATRFHDRRVVPVLDLGGPLGKALYLTAYKLHPMKGLAKPKK